MNTNKKFVRKTIIFGCPKTGKSCLRKQIAQNKYNEQYAPTIGVQFSDKDIKIKDKSVKLQIWQLVVGNQIFDSLINRDTFIKNSSFIGIFDLTQKTTFDKIIQNIQLLLQKCQKQKIHIGQILLVGNKKDLKDKRIIESIEIKKQCERLKIKYIEISAINLQDGNNILEILMNQFQPGLIQGQEILDRDIRLTDQLSKKSSPLVTLDQPLNLFNLRQKHYSINANDQ